MQDKIELQMKVIEKLKEAVTRAEIELHDMQGITQPPVAAFAVYRLFQRAKNRDLAIEKARALLPKLHAWHAWFFQCRDPQDTGLVAVIHPWETGRDNSIDWYVEFDPVPAITGIRPAAISTARPTSSCVTCVARSSARSATSDRPKTRARRGAEGRRDDAAR